jgi:hypothetical protein
MDQPFCQTNIHVAPETKIKASRVPGCPGRYMVELGDYGVCIFAGVPELTKIVAAIESLIGGIATAELTVERDEAEAERFRRECERDAKGEDE